MIEIKLSFATPEEAADAMLKLAGQDYSPTDTAATAPAEQPVAKARTPRKAKAAEDLKPAEDKGNISTDPENRQDPDNPEPEVEETAAEPESAPAPVEMTKEEVEKAIQERIRPALSNYMKAFGQAEARAFLAKFQGRTPETAKLSEIEPARFAEFEQAVEKAIAEKEGA